MKKSKRKANLKASLLVLLLIAILLMSSTYAWFTSNTQVTISTLNVQVEAQNGLQISADGTNWKTILNNEDIDPTGTLATTYAGNTNDIPEYIEPVSSVGNVDSGTGNMEMFYGITSSDADSGSFQLKATKGDAEGNYIVFDIFLRVEQQTQLALTANSGVSDAKTSGKGLENAARVGFVVEGNQPVGTDLETIQGMIGGTAETTYIWEPNSDAHTDAAIANAKNTYGVDIEANTPVQHYGVKAEIKTPIPLINTHTSADPTYFELTDTIQTSTTMEETQLLTLDAGITKVRVYMWVEGQDFDCDNSASGSDLNYDLQFAIPTQAEQP